jgi:hypothetical protein
MQAVVWFVLLALPLGAAEVARVTPMRMDERRAATTTLVWVDLTRRAPLPAAWVQQEAARLLRQGGLEGAWRSGAANEVLQPGELAVILLERRGSTGRAPLVMGACDPSSGTPAVWVFLDDVKRTLGYPAGVPLPARETLLLARAVGRVVAHELIHMAVPDLGHADTGLMSARLDRRDLLSRGLIVDRDTRRDLSRLSPNSWLPQSPSMAWNRSRSVSSVSVSSEAR